MDLITISAIITGVIAIIGAIAGAAVSIIVAMRETKKEVKDVASQAVVADAKLDRIEVLVDGRYSKVLQELADVKAMLARETGHQVDSELAVVAQKTADEQEERVQRVTLKKPKQEPPKPTQEPPKP